MLKAGIVGCGGIARGKHVPSIVKIKDVQIVALCDIKPERMDEFIENYSLKEAKKYEDYTEMLKSEKLDVVYVLTPNDSHAPISIAAMEAGCHVMCEKPMAKTTEQAKAMLDCAKKTGKILTIGYQNRFRPDSLYLKKACERGDLGEVYYAKAHAIRRRAVPTWGVFLDSEAQGGGPLIDIGTHALDMTLWLMDNYKIKSVRGSVYRKLADQTEQGNAFGNWDPKEFTVEDSAFGFITMENGATILLESSWALNTLDTGEAQVTLCGTEAGADMKDGLRFNKIELNQQTVVKPDLTVGGVPFYEGVSHDPADVEANNFIDSVKSGKQPMVTAEQAYVVTQVLDAIYESSKLGKEVQF